MSKFAAILAPLLLALFLAPISQAAVPSLKQTQQYKALDSYVSYLQGLQTTPATQEQKNTFQANLTIRVNNASARAASLDASRRSQAKNKFISQKQRILKQAKNNAAKQKRQALATYKRYSNQEREAYQAEVTRISLYYDDDIAAAKKQIKKLTRQLNSTSNPQKMVALEKKIENLQDRVASDTKKRQQEKAVAQRQYKKDSADELAAYQRRLNRINRRFQNNLASRNAQAKKSYNTRLAAIAKTQASESDAVSNLSTRGSLYISNMPSAS